MRFQHGEFNEVDRSVDDGNSLPSIYIPRKMQVDFLALLKETEIELRRERIFGASSLLAESVLVLNIASRQTNSRESLEQTLTSQSESDVLVFIGIPTMAVIMANQFETLVMGLKVGRFTVGGSTLVLHNELFPPNSDSKGHKVPTAGTWIGREPISLKVLSAPFDKRLPKIVREHHLGVLAGKLAQSFKLDFAYDQSIPAVLGAPAFDNNALFQLDGLRIDVSFNNLGSTSQILLADGSIAIPENISDIGSKSQLFNQLLGDKPIGSCPDIDRMLETFSRFLLKGKSHDIGRRLSDAYIHCVFALDLALGGKQEPTKSITKRAAVIYSAESGMPFDVAQKELKIIYDARSRYVHDGVAGVDADELAFKGFERGLEVAQRSIAELLITARLSLLSSAVGTC